MKVLIVGGVAGGAGAAARLRRNDEHAEIILFEKGQFISFANCGLPYYIGGTINEKEALQLQTPEAFNARFNVDVRVLNEVLSVDSADRTGLLSMIRSNVTQQWNLDDALKLNAVVYPFYAEDDSRSASQDVTWNSSSKKIALVHEDGTVEILKTGTVTITATAADGSNQKVSFKLKVVAE